MIILTLANGDGKCLVRESDVTTVEESRESILLAPEFETIHARCFLFFKTTREIMKEPRYGYRKTTLVYLKTKRGYVNVMESSEEILNMLGPQS